MVCGLLLLVNACGWLLLVVDVLLFIIGDLLVVIDGVWFVVCC